MKIWTNKVIRLCLLLTTGLVTVVVSLSRSHYNNLNQSIYQVKLNKYSLNFYHGDANKPVFKISPLDDYYYLGNTKYHVSDNGPFESSPPNILESFLGTFTDQGQLSWTVTGKDNLKLTYQVTSISDNTVKIKRHFSNLENSTTGVGQSITFCDDCLLIDQKKRAFFNSDQFEEKTNLAQSLGFQPIFISSESLPQDITQLNIVDKSSNPLVAIIPEPNQIIYYDEKWHLLEIKNEIKNTNSIDTFEQIHFIP